MKICSPQLGLSPNSDLGGEVHDHFVLQGLANKGHRIFVYLPPGKDFQTNKNIFVKKAPIKHIPAITFNLLILPYLFKTYKSEKFDVLRVHSPYFVGLGAIIFKIFYPRVKLIATYHLEEKSLIYELINKITIHKYDKIITVSNFLKTWIKKNYNVDTENINVIYNGVSQDIKPGKKDPTLVKKYNLSKKVTLLFVGLLNKRKNPLFLIKLFKTLKSSNKNVALLICGKGSQYTEIKDYINKNELKDVHIIGKIDSLEKSKYLNLCDIFTMPSKNEGFGLVVAEAMACAKPVLASNNTSLSEIIKDQTDGLLAKTNDEKDWIKKIELLVNDEALREKLSKNALYKSRSHFNWKSTVEQTEKVFKNLL